MQDRAFLRRLGLAGPLLAAAAILPGAASAADSESVTVGPWTIAAEVRNAKFLDCTMTRTTPDGVEVNILRDGKGVALQMTSPKWRLGRDKSYPVDLVAGNLIMKADVSADGNAVSVRLTDDAFIGKLANADELDVKGAGSTIKVALDQSAAALDRLAQCYETNMNSSAEANPFVAPKHKP